MLPVLRLFVNKTSERLWGWVCFFPVCSSGAEPTRLGGGDLLGGLLGAAWCSGTQHLEAVEIWNLPRPLALPQFWLQISAREIWKLLLRSQTKGNICLTSLKKKSSFLFSWQVQTSVIPTLFLYEIIFISHIVCCFISDTNSKLRYSLISTSLMFYSNWCRVYN